MSNPVTIDLSKLPADVVAALQASGALTIPAVAPAGSPAPSVQPAPAPTPALPSSSSGAATNVIVQPPSLADKIQAATNEIGQVLSTGIAGTEGAEIGQAAELAAGVGNVIWQIFNPHTGHTAKHKTLKDAVAAGAAHMQQQQAGAVDKGDPNVGFDVTPMVHVTAADVKKLPTAVTALKPLGHGV